MQPSVVKDSFSKFDFIPDYDHRHYRHYGFDVLRVLACYMVMQIHTGEFYYIGNGGVVINSADSHIVGWHNSLFRICVPLFVMLSGYYLFPITDTASFFRKRLSRVAVPFVLWCALYAFYYYIIGAITLPAALVNILKIPVNYGVEVGHLWFVYMLLGIYLFAPLISNWIVTCTRRSMEFYLLLWAIAMSIPYIHLIFPEVLGECYWNKTPMLYYFSGFLGYAILANYIKRFHLQAKSWNYVIGILFIIAGYAVTALLFEHRLATEKETASLELSWGFETINVALMTAGIFLILKNVTLQNTASAGVKVLSDISAKSYGMYLAHIMVLNLVHHLIDPHFNSAAIKLPLIAGLTFIITYLIIKVISYLPKSKWMVG